MATTTTTALPTLPQNVSIFSPSRPETSQSLLRARLFTKLAASARTTPAELQSALSHIKPKSDRETFCLAFRKGILIFDGGDADLPQEEAEALLDAHHEHFRQVCLALKDADVSLDFSACVFDAGAALEAGFQLDGMEGGAALVIDLMDGGVGDEDEDEDEDDEAAAATLNALVGRNAVEAQ